MDNLLEKFDFNLTDSQIKLLAEKLSTELNSYEQEELEKVLKDTDLLYIVSQMFYQGSEKSMPEKHTKLFDDYKIDLDKLFAQSGELDSLISSLKNMNKSDLSTMITSLDDIENELKIHDRLTQKDDGFIHGFREDFNDESGFANPKDKNLFIDTKIGLNYDENLIMELDKTRRGVVLNKVNINRPFISNVKKVNQTGENLIEDANKTNSVESIFDGDVWSEIVLTDMPFDINIKEPLYYDNKKGAMCKLQIVFDNIQPVNNISIDPFFDLPFEIVSIFGYKNIETMILLNNDDNDIPPAIMDDVVEIISPENNDPYKNFMIDKPAGINFKRIEEVKAIEIAIRQPHYKLDTYNFTEREVNNVNIVEKLFDKLKFLKTVSEDRDINSIIELDNYNKYFMWGTFSSVFEKFSELLSDFGDQNIIDRTLGILDKVIPGFNKNDFSKVKKDKVSKSKSKVTSTKKYNYQYGLKNIDINNSQFSSMGMFVSKAYDATSNVKEFALEVDDYIPKIDGELCGSIEYYISSSGNPGKDEWHRVIPENKDRNIKNEFMYSRNSGIKNGNKTELIFDFPANAESINIYDSDGNEVKITKYFDENNIEIKDELTPVQKIWLTNKYNTSELYFADYKIHDDINPFVVDLEKVAEPKIKIEEFNETDEDNMIQLGSYPFINYNKVNTITVDPDVIAGDMDNVSSKMKKLIYNNPNTYEFNPNYSVNDSGYRPIEVSLKNGDYYIYDQEAGDIIPYEEKIENDNYGLPYSYTFYDDNENIQVTRNEDMFKFIPYFYNKTKYKDRVSTYLNRFDFLKYPVIEYTHEGNNLIFNTRIGEGEDLNGTISVKYKYLTDKARVKAVVRKKSNDNTGTTPIINSYLLKSRDFQY